VNTFEIAKRYLKIIIKETFDFEPDVTCMVDPQGLSCELKGSDDDIKKVVGKEGSVIKAVRKLANQWGYRNHINLHVFIRRKEKPEQSNDNT